MNTVCEPNQCVGCSLCVDTCPESTILIKKDVDTYNAIKGNGCIQCGLCEKICPQNSPVAFKKQIRWYQGWAIDSKTRNNAASGGVASELAVTVVQNGGAVASCTFDNGEFVFQLVENIEDLKRFAGSKYIKSNPTGIYRIVKEKLRQKQVLFVGLPCQVAALYRYLRFDNITNLITVDLICHGTPSIELLKMYLHAYKIEISNLEDIKFRVNDVNSVKAEGYVNSHSGIRDLYMMSFLDSVSYTENCYHCQYARLDRVADITLGDSWGSDLAKEQWDRGISLILCQSVKGKRLIENANLFLNEVDLDKAIDCNHQLQMPSTSKGNRTRFMNLLKQENNFVVAYFKAFPTQYCKRLIKIVVLHLLCRLGILKKEKYDPFSVSYRRKMLE